MSATVTFLNDPGSVTVKVDCPHGTFSATLVIDPLDPATITEFARLVVANHRREYGCDCEIDVLVNGEEPVQ